MKPDMRKLTLKQKCAYRAFRAGGFSQREALELALIAYRRPALVKNGVEYHLAETGK